MKKVSDVFKVGENKIGWVDSSFTNEFGNDELNSGLVLPQSQKLTRPMNDSEIIKEFGIQECTLGDVLATLETATDDMKDGYANIFYIKGHSSRVVRVSWYSGYGEWDVYVWLRVDNSWIAGSRVFSPATVSGSVSTLNSETLALSPKYAEMVEWLYLNTGNEISKGTKEKLLEKLKQIL